MIFETASFILNSEIPLKIIQSKKLLRTRASSFRQGMGEVVRKDASKAAVMHFLGEISINPNAIVSLYWPFGDELDCRGLIKPLIQKGCEVCLPVLRGANNPLVFRTFTGEENLVTAAFGTSEPGLEGRDVVPDVMVLPLLGFDKTGARLGYGKGYYDRTIAQMAKKPELIGLAFAGQEIDSIPVSAHDVPLEKIVTEQGIRHFQNKENSE